VGVELGLKRKKLAQKTERRGRVGDISASYSGGTGFKSRPGG
jgi:hypothetical protein